MKKNWERKKLGELCLIVSGSTPKTSVPEYWEGGTLKWITPAEISESSTVIYDTGRYITEKAVRDTGLNSFPIDTVLLSSRAPIGKVAIAGVEMFCNQGFKNLICNPKSLKPKFLYYFLKNSNNYLQSLGRGATFKEISKAIVHNIPIHLPPIEEQERIVEELDTLHRIRDLQQKALDALGELAQATFYSLFGDPIDNEKAWPTKKIGEVCEITSSKRIFAKEYVDSGIPFYRSKEIVEKAKCKELSVELFISEARYKEIKMNFGIPMKGDILMTAVGTIGETWVIDTDEPFYFKDGNIVWIKTNDHCNSVFLRHLLEKVVKEYKKKMSVGSAYSALTIVNLKSLSIPLPPLSLQEDFAERIAAIEEQKQLLRTSIAESETLIAYTMDKYFAED